jgi:fructosamine-3-kinase
VRREDRIAAALGAGVRAVRPLSGGCIAEVLLVETDDGGRAVAKVGGAGLAAEAAMLRYLAAHTGLPVPRVLHAEAGLLLLEHLPGRPGGDDAEDHAGALLAALHDHAAARFGFDEDTVIAGLRQPNAWSDDWPAFYAGQRLLPMARAAVDAGRLPAGMAAQIERLAGRLDRWLAGGNPPGLVHGDVWAGNVLAERGRITGFLDPAIYFADPEVELGFITLFSTFGERFFAAYRERRPVDAGFFEARQYLYWLYPLLVHVRLFGGGYVGQLAAVVRRFAG